jgi:uncharacterized membrane protein HdeD (DUF308 family)
MALGAAAIVFPAATSIGTAYVTAWVLMLGGLAHFLFAWRFERYSMVLSSQLIGLAYLFTGFSMLQHPLWGALGLAAVLSGVLFVEGTLTLILYFFNETTSGWMLVDGMVTLGLASIIAAGWPFSSIEALGTLVGLNLLMTGTARLGMWMEERALIHRST